MGSAEKLGHLIDLLRSGERGRTRSEKMATMLQEQPAVSRVFDQLGVTSTAELHQVHAAHQMCNFFSHQAIAKGTVVMKQNTKNDLKFYIILKGTVGQRDQVGVFRDEGKNMYHLAEKDVNTLWTLNEARRNARKLRRQQSREVLQATRR